MLVTSLGPEEDVPRVNITGKNTVSRHAGEGGRPSDSGSKWPRDVHMPVNQVFLTFLIFSGRNLAPTRWGG